VKIFGGAVVVLGAVLTGFGLFYLTVFVFPPIIPFAIGALGFGATLCVLGIKIIRAESHA
jgi:hypothetical protein